MQKKQIQALLRCEKKEQFIFLAVLPESLE